MAPVAALRIDAQRNREQILLAAREIFATRGPDAPLDSIARRAGVGMATVYRRFPDRSSLISGVAVDILEQLIGILQTELADPRSGFAGLRRFMHEAIDLRVGSLIPILRERTTSTDEVDRLRIQTTLGLEPLIERAHATGELRPDATVGDLLTMTYLLSRPVEIALAGPYDWADLAHRQLDIYLAGLRAQRDRHLSGPALSLPDLENLLARQHTRG